MLQALFDRLRHYLARLRSCVSGNDGELKDLFAYFGRTVYMANVLEEVLVQTLLQVEYMINLRATVLANKGEDFDRERYERGFDAYLEKQRSKTMGQLARRVAEFPDLSGGLKARISDAFERRNFLIHEYWREAGYAFSTKQGRDQMITELSKDTDTFEKLASDIMEATKPVRKRLGISEEILDERVEERMARQRDGLRLD